MNTALLIISLVLSAICLVLVLYLLFALKKKGMGGTDAETLRRLENKTDTIGNLTDINTRAMDNLNRATEARLNNIQTRLTEDMKYIVETNAQNLERIRRTVDEKLTTSIDGKLSESYARISDRLEKMYESVGEMRSLSSNVSDIHRIFTNVKLRGSWGEAQLETLLEQMLAPEQYARNIKCNPLENSLVDFVIILPDKNGESVYLPVDSKFPVEEFERLCEAAERGDKDSVERASKNLERAVKTQAESIARKYIRPPATTDFAVMYLPSEGLYSEVVKAEGLSDFLRTRRILACGPTNLCALLSTLQTGFRTAAIERRSGELREMLETFRADFIKFAEALEKTRKKLQEATDSVESAEKRTGTIGRKLASFQGFRALPEESDDESL
ncbi:MAG: DNA recombination protein RmuC [Clostridiales bacterium]|nr:DNA recombination protein RmuC [Clostridiales bacterium]